MTTLSELTREVIAELDADGAGFRTREASNLLFHRVTDGLDLPRHVADLCRLGASVAITGNKPERALAQRTAAVARQSDFAETAPGFDHWLTEHAAMDESSDAVRKKVLRMTLPELRQVITLRRRKAEEMTATTRRLQQVIDEHPEWEDSPETPMAEILGISE
jgi:hypothetical protein